MNTNRIIQLKYLSKKKRTRKKYSKLFPFTNVYRLVIDEKDYPTIDLENNTLFVPRFHIMYNCKTMYPKAFCGKAKHGFYVSLETHTLKESLFSHNTQEPKPISISELRRSRDKWHAIGFYENIAFEIYRKYLCGENYMEGVCL